MMSTAVSQMYFLTVCDWNEMPVSKNGMEVSRFACTIRRDSLEARRKWYVYFARGVVDSYEQLGHILYRLRMLTVDREPLFFALYL